MAGRTGRRRVLLLFAVLAGLFLMHGLSTPSMHGMPMPMPMPMQMSVSTPVSVSSPMDSAMPAPTTMATAISSTAPKTDHMEAGETCVPLRPEGMSALFLALFLIVITLWRPRLPHSPRLIHPHWPHGPPRTGARILRTLSISRT